MAVSQSLAVTQSSQNVSGNYSEVRIVWKSTQTGESWNGYTRTAYYYVSINGGSETRYSVSYTLPKGSTKTLVDVTITVNHKADGAGNVKVRTWMDTGISAGEIEQSKTLTLDTIPRATTPTLSASSADMDSKVTINTPRASSSFTHDLAYSFNGAAYVSIATGVGTSYSWTVPDKASSIPNATSGTMTVRCITKSGSTTIGTKTVTLTAKVPASVVPTISSLAVSEATAGLAAQFGAYIQGKSKLSVKITAAGAKSSTIKSYSTTISTGGSSTAASFTTAVLPKAGTVKITTTVKDSRGRTATKSVNITVLAYTKPAIQALNAYRCNANGVAVDDGEYIAVHYKYSVPSLNGGNTAHIEYEYKRATETTWESLWSGTYGLSKEETWKPSSPTFSADYSYNLRMTVTDYFGAATVMVALLPSAEAILDISADGKSLSIGGTAERPGFTVKWLMQMAGGREDPVLPAGTDLNAIMVPNTYAGNAATTAGYLNCPITSSVSFTMEVASGGDNGQLMQRITTCSKTAPTVYLRYYYQSAWGDWVCINYEPGWKSATLEGDFELYSTGNPVLYRRSGNTVEIKGAVKPTSAIAYSADFYTITTLPAGYRPGGGQAVHSLCQGSGTCVWLMRVTAGGEVQFSRYRDGNNQATAGVSSWLPFCLSFLTD